MSVPSDADAPISPHRGVPDKEARRSAGMRQSPDEPLAAVLAGAAELLVLPAVPEPELDSDPLLPAPVLELAPAFASARESVR